MHHMGRDIAVSLVNVSKVYKFYRDPVERLKSFFVPNRYGNEFVALRDITLTIEKGKTIGIIGENGAGKSTLLKILSRVIEPTSGVVQINGNVLSILELGVGLHPEFTGRENILFYGEILGYSRDFLVTKTNDIISFSELGDFIDKPIKTYSSGMLMRLAFSIVSSLDPEIIILDEVLAVGDMHFQQKSLGRILEFKKSGKTIIFCSHDMYQIRMISDEVIWIKDGMIQERGEPEKVVFNYEMYQMRRHLPPEDGGHSNAPVIIRHVRLVSDKEPLRTFDDLVFEVETISADDRPYHVMLSLKLEPTLGICAVGTHLRGLPPLRGSRRVQFIFPRSRIIRGSFYAHARIFDETGLTLYHERVTPFIEVLRDCDELGLCYLDCEITHEEII